jgi:hypothetical protein
MDTTVRTLPLRSQPLVHNAFHGLNGRARPFHLQDAGSVHSDAQDGEW